MKVIQQLLILLILVGFLHIEAHANNPLSNISWTPPPWEANADKSDLENLIDLLSTLENAAAENEWLWILELHFNSVKRLIETYPPSAQQTMALISLFSDSESGAGLEPYIQGQREFLLAYDSNAGDTLSYVRCTLPNNWDPNRRYPLYVWARGGGSTPYPGDVTERYDDQINGAIIGGTPSAVYKEGFTIMPGGLGARTYLDDPGGLDFIEGIDAFRELFQTDPRRYYMGGFSNGGKGTYLIGAHYMEKYRWAALGMCAPAVNSDQAVESIASKLVDVPIWMAVGADDTRWKPNTHATRDILTTVGNPPEVYYELEGVGHQWSWDFQDSMYLFLREKEYLYPGGPPPIPENFRVTSVRDNSATLHWTLPEGLEEAEIRVEFGLGEGNGFVPFPRAYLPPGTTSYHAQNLDASTTYRFRIYAYDKTGDSEKSSVVKFTTGENFETEWAGYPMEENGHVDTDGFLGLIFPLEEDFLWIWSIRKFAYLPESHVTSLGAWTYVMRN